MPVPCLHHQFIIHCHLVALEHTVDKISQRSPEILATGEVMLVNEKNVVLETSVEMSLETELTDDWVVVAIDVGVDTVHALEYLSDHAREGLRERYT